MTGVNADTLVTLAAIVVGLFAWADLLLRGKEYSVAATEDELRRAWQKTGWMTREALGAAVFVSIPTLALADWPWSACGGLVLGGSVLIILRVAKWQSMRANLSRIKQGLHAR